jgi:hypothetical protein
MASDPMAGDLDEQSGNLKRFATVDRLLSEIMNPVATK